MDIRNRKHLHKVAANRLERAQQKKQIILTYTLISLGLSAVVTVCTHFLGNQISQTGGLQNMGLRSILSTLETLLPIVQSLALLCLELGFLNAMLRISRGLFTSVQSLRAGFSRFWAALRCSLLLSLRYIIAGMASFYLALMVFGLTPLSNKAAEILMPMSEQMTTMTTELVIDEATVLALGDAMTPFFVLFGIIAAVMVVPMYYRYRLANYILMDKPGYGALRAINESRLLMRGNCFALFRLDLSLWWYYLLAAASTAICYGDAIVALAGISLPWSQDVSFWLFYGLFVVAQFLICYFFGNRVGVTYALAYEALKPKEPETGGVVLGNIFQA